MHNIDRVKCPLYRGACKDSFDCAANYFGEIKGTGAKMDI